MIFITNLLIIVSLVMVQGGYYQEFELPYYDDMGEKVFRKKYTEYKEEKEIKTRRTELLDKTLFNNTVYVDGIIHYEINEENTNNKKIKKIENDFKNILAMRGVKYVYKRGLKWRTWREVKIDGGKKVYCYVCDSIVKENCTNCHYGGHWIIEEKPPCPYELFSIKENKICAKNYTQYTNLTDDCPSQIKFEDLSVDCENPIETIWQISRDYKAEKYPNSFCEKDYCEIITVYTIDAQGISFRMINSSNIIFYSRVMRDGGKNYACIDDCGNWDPNAKKLVAQSKPLSFNLLERNKKKREDISASIKQKSTKSKKKSTKTGYFKIKNKIKKYIDRNTLSMEDKSAREIRENKFKTTTESYCKKLMKKENDYAYDYNTSEYE